MLLLIFLGALLKPHIKPKSLAFSIHTITFQLGILLPQIMPSGLQNKTKQIIKKKKHNKLTNLFFNEATFVAVT